MILKSAIPSLLLFSKALSLPLAFLQGDHLEAVEDKREIVYVTEDTAPVYVTDWAPTPTVWVTVQATAGDTTVTTTSKDVAEVVVTATTTPAAVATTSTTPQVAVVTTSTPAAAAVTTTSTPAAAAVTTTSTPVAAAVTTTSTPAAAAVTTTSTTPAAVTTTSTTPAAVTTTSTTPAAVVTTTSTTPVAVVTTSSTSHVVVVTTSTTSLTTTPHTTSTSTSAAVTTTSSSSGSSYVPYAVTYNPYNSDQSCRSASDVYSDIAAIAAKGVKSIRIYSPDCNSLETVNSAASKLGLKIIQGFWMSTAGVDSIDDQVTTVIDWTSSNGWGVFDFFIIGNEGVVDGYVTVEALISKIASVKAKLQGAGYTGKVSTAEPYVSFKNNPSLCTESAIDFVCINSYSFFNQDFTPAQAGEFTLSERSAAENTCGKTAFVSETGYPSAGDSYGKNTPSVANQKIAIDAQLESLQGYATWLSAYDDKWKSPGDLNVEQHFGMLDQVN